MEKHTTRIDKWLWAVRIFKTRIMTTEACAGGKVKIDGETIKASRKIQPGDIVQVRKGMVKYLFKIREVAEKRMSAKLVHNFLEDMTPNEELAKLKAAKHQPIPHRKKGKGRPTKRERRIMDEFRENY